MNLNSLSAKEKSELVRDALEPLLKKWNSQIVSVLLRKEKATFTELRESLEGVSNKVLSDSLNDLRDRGVVEKTDEEGKEYRLTEKGKSLEPVFNELVRWGENYLREDKIGILIVEDNEPQAEMYSRWLEPEYSVDIATDFSEMVQKYDPEHQILLLDRKLDGTSAEDIIGSIDGIKERQIILITGMEPDIDVLDLPINNYIIKPVRKDTLKDSVRKMVEIGRRTKNEQELASLQCKKSVLDQKNIELKDDERYRELIESIEELKEDVDRETGV